MKRTVCRLPTKLVVAGKVNVCGNLVSKTCANCGFNACWRHFRRPCPQGAETALGTVQHLTERQRDTLQGAKYIVAQSTRLARFPNDDPPCALLAVRFAIPEEDAGGILLTAFPGALLTRGRDGMCSADRQLVAWLTRNGLYQPDGWQTSEEFLNSARAWVDEETRYVPVPEHR